MTDFVTDLLSKAEPILAKILLLPFNQQIASGDLKQDRFDCYLVQDVWYLKNFSHVLQQLADKNPESPFRALGLAEYIKTAEQLTNEQLISPNSLYYSLVVTSIDKTAISSYLDHLDKTSTRSFAEALAACIPCFWVYQKLGELLPISTENQNKTYKNWLSTYTDQEFIAKTNALIALLSGLDSNLYDQQTVHDAFMTSLQHEHDFFASIISSEPSSVEHLSLAD